MTPSFRVTAESLGHQAIGAFRTMAQAEVAMPRDASRPVVASRIKVPWEVVIRRKVQAIVNFEDRKVKK